MIDRDSLDPFTSHLIDRIDPKVRDSLTPNQFSAIIEAVRASRPMSGHPVDIRGVIPLFFARFYFVFLMGRDRRSASRRVERKRLTAVSLFAWTMFLLVVASPFIVIVMLLLYYLKSSLGIDLFPESHLSDVLKMR